MRMNTKKLMDTMHMASMQMSSKDLAYLFATGKSELEFRNQIALHLHKIKTPSQVIAREWKRHDLTILESGVPKVIVEGKSWIHFDATYDTKLRQGNRSILSGMLKDIQKMEDTKSKFPEVDCFISVLLFTVDVSQVDKKALHNAQVTYADQHKRAIKKYGSAEGVVQFARSNLKQMLEEYGHVERKSIETDSYLGMPVFVDLFLIQPTQLMNI